MNLYIKPIIVTGLNTRGGGYIMNITFNANSFANIARTKVNNYNKNISSYASKDFNTNKNQSIDVGRNAIVYMKKDDMLYSGGNGTGLSFTVKYAENSSKENLVVIAKGLDENRNEFEQTFNLNDIDMTNASTVEMKALEGHLERHLKLDRQGSLSTLPMGTGRMNLNDKRDFVSMFEGSIKEQITLGQYDVAMRYKRNLKIFSDFFKKN